MLVFSEDSGSIDISTPHTPLISSEGIDILRLECTEQTLLALDISKALLPEVRDDESSDPRYVGASHRSTLHVAVLLTCDLLRKGTQYLALGEMSISTRSSNIDPVATIGVVGSCPVRSHRSDGHNWWISTWIRLVVHTIITSSKDDDTALHRRVRELVTVLITACVLDEVVDSSLVCLRNRCDISLEDIAPRVLTDDCTIIGTVVHSPCATPTFILCTEDLAAH